MHTAYLIARVCTLCFSQSQVHASPGRWCIVGWYKVQSCTLQLDALYTWGGGEHDLWMLPIPHTQKWHIQVGCSGLLGKKSKTAVRWPKVGALPASDWQLNVTFLVVATLCTPRHFPQICWLSTSPRHFPQTPFCWSNQIIWCEICQSKSFCCIHMKRPSCKVHLLRTQFVWICLPMNIFKFNSKVVCAYVALPGDFEIGPTSNRVCLENRLRAIYLSAADLSAGC